MKPSRTNPGLIFLSIVVAVTLLAPTGLLGATWREGDRIILSLDEFLARVGAEKQNAVVTDLPADTPVLMGRDFTEFTPQFIYKAMLQNSLMVTPDERGPVMHRSGQFAERPTSQNREYIEKLRAPDPQKSGAIPTGGAVLFGTLVEPPFVVESNGRQLLVNGLPVFPQPGVQREPAVITPRVENQHDLLTAARAAYHRDRNERGIDTARENLIATLVNHRLVGSAEWTSDTDLIVRWQDGDELIMTFGPPGRSRDPNIAEHEAEVLEWTVKAVRDCLQRGHTVVAGADYFQTVTDTPAAELLPRLREILTLPESDELKRCRLQARTEESRAALDILAEN